MQRQNRHGDDFISSPRISDAIYANDYRSLNLSTRIYYLGVYTTDYVKSYSRVSKVNSSRKYNPQLLQFMIHMARQNYKKAKKASGIFASTLAETGCPSNLKKVRRVAFIPSTHGQLFDLIGAF